MLKTQTTASAKSLPPFTAIIHSLLILFTGVKQGITDKIRMTDVKILRSAAGISCLLNLFLVKYNSIF